MRHMGFEVDVCRRTSRGFTLVELVVTLAVLAIVIGIAVPAFNALIQRNRLTTAANEMVAALQTAKLEAVRRNRRVEVCPTANGSTCSGSDWGRVLIRSAAGPIREFETVRAGTAINAAARGASGASVALTSIAYAPSGRATASAALPVKVEFVSTRLPAAENKRLVHVDASRVSACRGSSTKTACE
jgi:type IV fimbrial biogenesis protein FimT